MTPAELRGTLSYIDANSAAIQVTGAMALLLGFVQYGEAIRPGFRDRTHAIPLVAVLFHLANDVSYSIHYFRWFLGSRCSPCIVTLPGSLTITSARKQTC